MKIGLHLLAVCLFLHVLLNLIYFYADFLISFLWLRTATTSIDVFCLFLLLYELPVTERSCHVIMAKLEHCN